MDNMRNGQWPGVHHITSEDGEMNRVCAAADCECSLDGCRHDGRRKPAQARFCSPTCASRTKKSNYRKRKRQGMFASRHPQAAELLESTDSKSLAELHDRARAAQQLDGEHQDDGLPDRRTAEQVEQDERIHQMLGIETGAAPRRRATSATWRRWREQARRNPGVEPLEQTQDRIDRQRATYDASMSRIDSMTDGRVQDRFDPRTASNLGRNGAASRKLNAAYVEQPPAWATTEFDFQPGESWNGGPFRSGRPAGQRSRNADYAWRMQDGFVHTGF